MAGRLTSLKTTLNCKTSPSEVHEPKPKRCGCCCGDCTTSACCVSVSSLKDAMSHGSKTQRSKQEKCSPQITVKKSSELITEKVISDPEFSDTNSEIIKDSKIVALIQEGSKGVSVSGNLGLPKSVDQSPGSAGLSPSGTLCSGPVYGSLFSSPEIGEFHGYEAGACNKCGELLATREDADQHHLLRHIVTEVVEGHLSNKIIEIIYKTGSSTTPTTPSHIQRILKVHNLQRRLIQFEEYREAIKFKSNRLSDSTHPRCLVDGNELLRFYGTTVSCPLGNKNGSTTLCSSSDDCELCYILRHGFTSKEILTSLLGVFTADTSQGAYKYIKIEGKGSVRRALIICRVIAGRVHKPMENKGDMGLCGAFDSVAAKIGGCNNIEELYSQSPRALLPCFVIICKQ